MLLEDWVELNRAEIRKRILLVCPNNLYWNTDDLVDWVLNDEYLYNWASSEEVTDL